MRWIRTDPVQTVGAVLVRGPGAVEGLNRAMNGKPAALRALPFARGEDWAVLFAQDGALPRLAEAMPLYEASPGWWLPVGWALAAPDHMQPALWQAIGEHYGLTPPAIVAPIGESNEADLYLVRHLAPFAREAAA